MEHWNTGPRREHWGTSMYTLHVYIDRCLKDHILNIVVQPTIDPTGNEVIYSEGSFEQMSN